MAPSIFFMHFIGLAIVILGLTLKEKRSKLGIAIALLGFLIATGPVWYGHWVGPSPSEMREMQLRQFMFPGAQ